MFKTVDIFDHSPAKSIHLSDLTETTILREKLEASERNYHSLEKSHRNVLLETTQLSENLHKLTLELNSLKAKDHENQTINDELRRDNEFLARSCNDMKLRLEHSSFHQRPNFETENLHEKRDIFSSQTMRTLHFSEDTQRPPKNSVELEALIVLLKAENDRLHGVCEDLSNQLHARTDLVSQDPANRIFTQFGEQIGLHSDIHAWKGRFYEIERNFSSVNTELGQCRERLAMFMRENEALKINLREKEEENKRIVGEWRECERMAGMVPEMNDRLQRMMGENERLKSVIMNRCRDLTRESWNF